MMRLFMVILAMTISGCATTQPANNADYSDLYAGRSQLVFGTEFPADSAKAALELGDRAYGSGELDQALFHYLQSVRYDDTAPDAFYRIGLIHRQRGDLERASRSFNHAVKRDQNHAAALEELGLIMLQVHKPEEASNFFARVLAIDPDRVRSHNGLGVIADLIGDHDRAADHFRQALKRQPESTNVLNNLGYSLYLTQKWDEAEQAFHKVLSINQNHELATRNLALLYARRGLHQRALKLLERVGGTAAANNDLGYLCMLNGQYEMAGRFFETAIELSPTYYELAHNNLIENRALARKAPDPRLARLFSPDPAPIAERHGSSTEFAAGAPETLTMTPAASPKIAQQALADVRNELPPIIESQPAAFSAPRLPESATLNPRAQAAPLLSKKLDNAPSNTENLYLKRFVHADALNVRDDASEFGSVLDRIHRGRVVRVLRQTGEWAYVMYWHDRKNGIVTRKGWVHASYLSETDYRGLS